ncbi:peptidase M16 [Gelidibacter algens]|nr:peptidase M16 [Gelidibacter algens]
MLTFSVVFSLQLVSAQDIISKFDKVQELGGISEYLYTPNGMNLLLLQDNSAPVVTVQIVYRVGSKHEISGNTGSTHLLEHLMFKGTPTFNKRNGNAISSVLQGIGAQMNATTWNDRTNYYTTIPSDKIALPLQIEADRMRNSLLLKEDKDTEMTVVRNEFERGENNPNSVLNKEVWASAYMAHTYHHSTIGWRSDIEKAPIETLRDFYNTYYWPDNATLTIIGDFQKESLFELIDKYFGKITKAPHIMPQPYTEEPLQYGPRRVVIKKPGQMSVILKGYKIPGRLHEDLPALQVLGQLIGSGPSSALNRELIDTGEAFYVYSDASNFQEVGLFTIGAGFNPSKKHEYLELKIDSIITKFIESGIQQTDVDRVVGKLNTQTILAKDGSGRIAGELNEAIAGGDWTDYVNGEERLKMVTVEDVLRVAKTYLVEDQSTTGYYIPQAAGSNQNQEKHASNYIQNDSKYYYRNTESEPISKENVSEEVAVKTSNKSSFEVPTIAVLSKLDYTRKKVAGIDVITSKTGAKGFVTVAASFPIAAYFNTKKNEAIPSLTTSMLSKGTTKNNKFQFSEKLEKLGVSLSVDADTYNVNFGFKCLAKDINMVVNLLAEELRFPLFDEQEFNILIEQMKGNLKQGLSDPWTKGNIVFSQNIYSEGHPNYSISIEQSIENIEKATIAELKAFHKNYFGIKDMHLVAVGDVDVNILYASLKKAFSGWNNGITEAIKYITPNKVNGKTEVVTIPQKPSAELFVGQYTGLKRSDADFIPFYIGNNVLGSGFSGRLMRTVRDEDGLTYSIESSHGSHIYTEGNWTVNASFNPSLFQQGLDATMIQIKKWRNEGVTTEEVEAIKSNLIGGFKVGMATTSGLANTILSLVERGLEPDYIDQYPKDIEAVTTEQVNTVIKKYIDLDKIIIIKSGSLDSDGNPLN